MECEDVRHVRPPSGEVIAKTGFEGGWEGFEVIKIVKGAEVDGPRGEAGGKRHGVFAYHADPELYPLVCGFSRQPLLDACRQLKSLYGVTGTPVGLFREGRDAPDISCPVEPGAAATVKEPDNGVLKFGKYRAVEASGCAATQSQFWAFGGI